MCTSNGVCSAHFPGSWPVISIQYKAVLSLTLRLRSLNFRRSKKWFHGSVVRMVISSLSAFTINSTWKQTKEVNGNGKRNVGESVHLTSVYISVSVLTNSARTILSPTGDRLSSFFSTFAGPSRLAMAFRCHTSSWLRNKRCWPVIRRSNATQGDR